MLQMAFLFNHEGPTRGDTPSSRPCATERWPLIYRSIVNRSIRRRPRSLGRICDCAQPPSSIGVDNRFSNICPNSMRCFPESCRSPKRLQRAASVSGWHHADIFRYALAAAAPPRALDQVEGLTIGLMSAPSTGSSVRLGLLINAQIAAPRAIVDRTGR